MTRDCRFKINSNLSDNDYKEKFNKSVVPLNKPVRTFCDKVGHSFESYFKRERAVVSNVNWVGKVKLNHMNITIDGFTFQSVFDSGAECSVISESIAAKVPGKRIYTVNYIRGIGKVQVISLFTLLTICDIDNVSFEIQFFVVPDCDMTSRILIGMELVSNSSLNVLVTATGTKLVRQYIVMHLNSGTSMFDMLDHGLSNDDEINQSRILLNKYGHLFIRGFSKIPVSWKYV